MNTANIEYQGALRTEATHLRSGNSLITDAPTDNHGKGETFSPTDLLATSLVSCMITVMGISADKKGIDLGEVSGTVKKIMADNPRRVAVLQVEIHFRNRQLSGSEKTLLENIALNCPVARSIHPDVSQQVKFVYE
ncbi:MAG: OsmC family protein [Bacteroidota bacterium]